MTDEGPKRKRPCIETEHGRRGGRAGADGRKIEKPFGASGFRIYKLWDEKTKKWIACEETTKRRKVDSYIYRYDRMKGFILPETSQQLLENDEVVKMANCKLRASDTGRGDSFAQITLRFATFEVYCRAAHPDTLYTKFLIKCCDWTDGNDPIIFRNPEIELVVAYMYFLRGKEEGDEQMITGEDGRYLKAGSIENYLSSISSTSIRYGHGPMNLGHTANSQIQKWVGDDGTTTAVAFDPYFAFPLLFRLCMDEKMRPARWSLKMGTRNWSIFLFCWCVVGRPACVTTHCPKWEDMEFPVSCCKYCPKTMMPKYTEPGFLEWKGRRKQFLQKRYGTKLFCTCDRDPRYCVLMWLGQYMISMEKEAKAAGKPFELKGKIFNLSECQFKKNMKTMFKHTNTPELRNCTASSIRRSAAQTGTRCKVDNVHIKATMREVSLDNVGKYIGEGPVITTEWEGDRDPLEDMWWYQPTVEGTREEVSAS